MPLSGAASLAPPRSPALLAARVQLPCPPTPGTPGAADTLASRLHTCSHVVPAAGDAPQTPAAPHTLPSMLSSECPSPSHRDPL